ncbi:RrF2 family transcriptional regulator [Microbacterium sp. NPDC055683]
MRISARAEYAVRAAVFLARAPGRLSSPRIAADEDIPAKFLEGILTSLVRAGIVASRRGANGGYELARPADAVTVADVIRAVDGPLVFVRDQRPSEMAEEGALLQLWVALRANVRSVLEGTTLADLAAERLPPDVAALTSDPVAWENP